MMFEIFGAHPDEHYARRRTTWIVRDTPVHRHTRTHTLAASDYSLVKEQLHFLKSYACNL